VVIPTEGVAGDSVAYDEVTAGHRYAFRVRTADGEWSEPVERLHVDTVLPEIHIGIDHPTPVFDERKNYYDVRVDVDPASTETGDRAERLQADARIRARGNSTLVDTPGKKSYQLKFD